MQCPCNGTCGLCARDSSVKQQCRQPRFAQRQHRCPRPPGYQVNTRGIRCTLCCCPPPPVLLAPTHRDDNFNFPQGRRFFEWPLLCRHLPPVFTVLRGWAPGRSLLGMHARRLCSEGVGARNKYVFHFKTLAANSKDAFARHPKQQMPAHIRCALLALPFTTVLVELLRTATFTPACCQPCLCCASQFGEILPL